MGRPGPDMSGSLQMLVRTYPVNGPLDLRRTLAPLGRGPGDRTIRFAAGRIW